MSAIVRPCHFTCRWRGVLSSNGGRGKFWTLSFGFGGMLMAPFLLIRIHNSERNPISREINNRRVNMDSCRGVSSRGTLGSAHSALSSAVAPSNVTSRIQLSTQNISAQGYTSANLIHQPLRQQSRHTSFKLFIHPSTVRPDPNHHVGPRESAVQSEGMSQRLSVLSRTRGLPLYPTRMGICGLRRRLIYMETVHSKATEPPSSKSQQRRED